MKIVIKREMYRIHLRHPFTMIIAGPTGCSKTQWIKNLISKNKSIIDPPPERIIYCYGEYQRCFSDMKNVEFYSGLNRTVIESLSPNEPNLLILDDLMDEISDDAFVSKLFTKFSHHRNISIILILQNFFNRGKVMRTLSLNSQYIVLFKNPRDKAQSMHLARQLYPNYIKKFLSIYNSATEEPFSYLFIDLKPETPEEVRLLSNVLDEQANIKAYKVI